MSWPAWLLVAVFTLAGGWVVVHKLRHASRRVTAALALVDPDRQPGTDTALHDTCALLWDLPAHNPDLQAGCDRLWQAIRDEQQKGDQGDQP
jgi:hypothetical protein